MIEVLNFTRSFVPVIRSFWELNWNYQYIIKFSWEKSLELYRGEVTDTRTHIHKYKHTHKESNSTIYLLTHYNWIESTIIYKDLVILKLGAAQTLK